jgi:hypothetical protein
LDPYVVIVPPVAVTVPFDMTTASVPVAVSPPSYKPIIFHERSPSERSMTEPKEEASVYLIPRWSMRSKPVVEIVSVDADALP